MSPHLTLKTLAATAATALVLAACSGGGSGDDPVSADQARTLAMLLGHTSGLGEWDAAGAILEDLNRTFTLEEVLTNHGQAAPHGEPAELFAYSNANYTAIGAMIERELDQDLAWVIDARFTGPLALEETWYLDTTALPTRHGWFGLDPSDSERMIGTVDTVFPAALSLGQGAGGLASSSDDLLDWGEALYSGEVLGDDATAAMVDMRSAFVLDPATERLVAADEPTPLHYGLGTMGWCLDARGCAAEEVDLVGHSGSVDGTRVLVGHHAASGTTIAVHANVGRIPQLRLVALLADVFAEMGIEPRASEQHP